MIYCTRTITELNQCMEELKRVVECRKKMLGMSYVPITGLCLSSRRNLCINNKINCQNTDVKVDISFFYSNVHSCFLHNTMNVIKEEDQ